MIKTLLPNARWLLLESENLGRDWSEKAALIDQQLETLGLDLAEESVYLLFDASPGSVLDGKGPCRVARPVIGPKRLLEGPLQLEDWIQASVYRKVLGTNLHWEELLDQAYLEWENLHRQNQRIPGSFMLLLKRQLAIKGNDRQFGLQVEVLFPAG